ncbi:MAG: VOC family protein [Streptosporangiales bacterium]
MKPQPAVIELVVSNMPASLAFYRRLGVDVPADADDQPHVDADLGGIRIAWDTEETIRSFDRAWSPPSGGHRVALAFALTAAGYEGHLEPWDAPWGMRHAVVHDPDGTTVDLFAPLPAS